MDEKPSRALRTGQGSSMWNALETVKSGESPVVISCGNTGALMALAMLVLRKAPGVEPAGDRRALAVAERRPATTSCSTPGADIRADAEDLLQVRGDGRLLRAQRARAAAARASGCSTSASRSTRAGPSCTRPPTLIAAAAPAGDFEYIGYVEGSDMASARVDVIVTDGFTGNVALKTGEGTAEPDPRPAAEAFAYSPLSRIGALFAYTSLERLSKRIDPRRVNGGVFLGLNGTVIKSHGSADATGVSAAIKLAFTLADHGFAEKLAARVGARARSAERPARRRPDMTRDCARSPAACGHYLPGPGRRERRVRGDARHLGRVDPHPHRHRAPPLRRRGRDDLRPRASPPRAPRSPTPASTAADLDAHHARDRDAGPDLPRHRDAGAGGARHDRRLRLRHPGGLRRLRLRARPGRRADPHRPGAPGAGDRRRDLLAHPRLDRPRHLRAVRRRRRRADPRGRARAPAPAADRGLLATDLHSDGRYNDLLYVDGGPSTTGAAGVVRMAGQEVFRTPSSSSPRPAPRRWRAPGSSHADVDWLVPHQANLRIMTHDRAEARRADGARGRHRAGPRQHLGRLDPAGAVGRPRATAASPTATWS